MLMGENHLTVQVLKVIHFQRTAFYHKLRDITVFTIGSQRSCEHGIRDLGVYHFLILLL